MTTLTSVVTASFLEHRGTVSVQLPRISPSHRLPDAEHLILRRVVLFVGAQVAGQFLDLGREDGNLYLGRPGVVLMRRELLNDVLLLALCQHRVGGGRARGWRDPWPRHRDELL